MDSGKTLNKEQVEAMNTLDGNLLIIASAGTGKTTTIVERYVNLVENQGYSPDEILMTTFTNKAAKDMMNKIAKRTKKIPSWIGTMHALFLRILRENAKLVLNNDNFLLLTEESEKKKIIKKILEKENIDARRDNISYFVKRIGIFKSVGILADSLKEGASVDYKNERIEEMIEDELIHIDSRLKSKSVRIYKEYQRYLKEKNLVDFDDIILLTYEILSKSESVRKKYFDKFKVIMVDEAQDLSVAQIRVLDLLENNNLCLIGDDCQNIYEWRGTSNDLVFKFDKHHKKVTLKHNYRSTNKIISAVNKIIDSLKFKISKELICTREEGSKILVESFDDFDEEIDYIVQKVKELLKSKVEKEDIAVLFRTNSLGKQIEREFRRNKIPCHLSRSRGFFEREEVRDILCFLRLKINPDSEKDFERLINLLPGFGKAKVEKLKDVSLKHKFSLIDSLDYSLESFNDSQKEQLSALKGAFLSKGNPIETFLSLFKYHEKMLQEYGSDPERIEDKEGNIDLMLDLYKEHSAEANGIRSFLDSLIELERKEKDRDKIVLTTIHSAKGLEWKYVFLAACNEEILPYYKEDLSTIKRDSELRLFYVAVSRAKDFLIITHSSNNNWKQDLEPSQFLDIVS